MAIEPAIAEKKKVAGAASSQRSAPRKAKRTRAEKAEQIRNDLFHAAAEVVGEQGYLNAMILMITQRAKVANGTFYNYFESRQDLFDQLLPILGREMLQFIADRSRTGESEFDREQQRFNAFFDYLAEHPEFYRILYEAEVFAPEAFNAHMAQVTSGYAGVLRKGQRNGEITGYTSKELDILALILMGARHYISMRFRNEPEGMPDWVADTYRKFIMGGLRAVAEE